jgi:hypothetical protein
MFGMASATTITGYVESDDELTAHMAACDARQSPVADCARRCPALAASVAAGRPTSRTWRFRRCAVADPRDVGIGIRIRPRQENLSFQDGVRDPASDGSRSDPGSWRFSPICRHRHPGRGTFPRLAMRRLATDPAWQRASPGAAGQRYWEQEHSMPGCSGLPTHRWKRRSAGAATRRALWLRMATVW